MAYRGGYVGRRILKVITKGFWPSMAFHGGTLIRRISKRRRGIMGGAYRHRRALYLVTPLFLLFPPQFLLVRPEIGQVPPEI